MVTGAELELFGNVLLAGLLGFIVGLERELMGSPAGDRTFSLVAIGSALFTTLSFEVFGARQPGMTRVGWRRMSSPASASWAAG